MRARSIWAAFARPNIGDEQELAAYVLRTTAACIAVALAFDIAHQLIFFAGWQASLRSWIVTVVVVLVIAVPVTRAVGRSHLELTRAKRALEELSRTDPLTGLLNRRALLEDAEARAPAALAIVDIDRFKAVNDTHGHLAGDEVICAIAHAMRAMLGAFGSVGRLGGEEFALLSSLPAGSLMPDLWEFRDRIAATTIAAGEADVRVTVSVGVADRAAGQTLTEHFAEADRALYLAKASGRNRVVSALELPSVQDSRQETAAAASLVERAFRGRA
jgi:diguanylate cyclase (GGDEF)-like protein